jgi:serine/threonine-protein kinase
VLASQPPNQIVLIGSLVSLDFVAGGYVTDPSGNTLAVSLVAGTLPPGVTLVGTLLSGFATTAGTYPLTFQFADPLGNTLNVSLSVIVQALTVPNVVGDTQATAIAVFSANGFYSVNTGTTYSQTIPAGIVVSQEPAAGTTVSTIITGLSIAVSLGGTVYPGPNITQWQALAILANAGFVPYPVIAYAYSLTVPDYYVLAQSIAPGSMITSSTGVQLTVSMGPPNPTTTSTIPSVVGLSLLDAMKKLVAAQCGVGSISWQLSATAPSTVLSQSPAAGGPVTEWTDVSLVFSSGPSITYPNTGTLTVPNVVT